MRCDNTQQLSIFSSHRINFYFILEKGEKNVQNFYPYVIYKENVRLFMKQDIDNCRNFKTLLPLKETAEFSGKLSYAEGSRAWHVIRLKKDILREFPQLKRRDKEFGYKIVIYRKYEELKKAIEEMEIQCKPIPMSLLILYLLVEFRARFFR